MKKIVLGLMLISFYASEAQEYSINFTLTNSTQVSSTVQIGKDRTASLGIDEAFEEVNHFPVEKGDVEIYSIQRTEEYNECLEYRIGSSSGEKMLFDENMDLKIDIRNDDFGSHKDNSFEIKFIATNYPLKLKIESSGWDDPIMRSYWIEFYDRHCNGKGGVSAYDCDTCTLEILEKDSLDRIIVYMYLHVSVEDDNNDSFIIYPNPLSNTDLIRFSKSLSGNIEILNFEGKYIFSKGISNQNEIRIPINLLLNGFYFIRYVDLGGNIFVDKLIVQ